ncbi:MAG TPA: hypothetical protein VFE54_09825, partial [Mucilaginibacter sp.]|nr:hypothetical protein [Mucilaginibacter sp.]
MKTANIWTVIVVVLLCVNSAFLVMMWQQKKTSPPGGQPRPEVKDFIIKELALTPAQTARFDSLREIHHRTIDSLNDETRRLKDQLFSNLNKPGTDATVVTA